MLSWRTGRVTLKRKRKGENKLCPPAILSPIYRIDEALNISAVQEETILLLEELVQALEQKIDTLTALHIGH